MISYMTGSASYLESVAPETVLSLLADKRTEGLAPFFDANNLTQEVIKNCSVRFTPAAEGKAQVNEFLTKLIAVNANAAGTVSDSFYYTGSADVSSVQGTYSVYAPDGAPALSLVNAVSKEDSHFDYHVVDSATIQTYVTGNRPTADFAVLPVNAGKQMLGNGETYQMLGTVTNGNLYFLSTGDNAVLSADQSFLSRREAYRRDSVDQCSRPYAAGCFEAGGHRIHDRIKFIIENTLKKNALFPRSPLRRCGSSG